MVGDAHYEARQRCDARQENPSLRHPSGSQVEQNDRAFGTHPSSRVQPTHQAPVFRLLGKIAVAMLLANFPHVSMVRRAPVAILSQAAWIRDLQLFGQVPHHDSGHVCRVRQERSQKAHSAELDGIPQLVMSATMSTDFGTIFVVQEEILR
jgi:hypothetical protein